VTSAQKKMLVTLRAELKKSREYTARQSAMLLQWQRTHNEMLAAVGEANAEVEAARDLMRAIDRIRFLSRKRNEKP
jgi:hypothetical protein